ncbi:bifunctional serine/threonine-protein kinase/ABC transporter substrate-binding protein [Nocardia sp. NPDC046763]|uniref:bifunctional serine/threonine-protein kinase/ABC transporter substrate-binding protein n=1 Tax=Nocardia sp. NPDC046763 TaxID=3155256 RepID=UPI0033E1CE04
MLFAGKEFAGYLIERRLGGGGMGDVFLARHPRLPRLVAIKLLARELVSQRETRFRFEREAELVARLDHPNIVAVHDRGVEDGRLWIAMQYVDGGDAAALDPFTLPAHDAVHIIGETAKALDYAHSMGVIHRDVKPANILLTRSVPGQDRRILLTDFGIGRLRDDSAQITRTGMLAATITYASPEQLSGAALDHRSDQYSLACTLFRLLSGSTPYQAETAAAVIAGHLQHPAPRVTDRRPELPAALDAVLARGLAKRPEDRFDSCRAFADAALQALSEESESTVLPLQVAAASPVTTLFASARATTTGPSGSVSATITLPPAGEATMLDEPSSPPAPPNRNGRRGRWIAAGAAALVVVIATAAGIVWATHDSGSSKNTPPANTGGPYAAVYPGFVPLTQIDALGDKVAYPVSVEDPANDGRLPCKPVSIAAAVPLTGADTDVALGRTVIDAVKLAVDQFVQGGGKACPVTVREFDTAGSQTAAAQIAEKIAADTSIVAVIGPALSREVVAAGQTFDAAGLSFLTPAATNPLLAQSGWSGFFRGLANDNAEGPALGRYLANTARFSRVCVVRDSGGGFGDSLADSVTSGLGTAALAGCEVSIDPNGDPGDAVNTIAGARPDAVFYAGYPPTAASLLTKLRSAGVTATFVLGDGSYDPGFRTLAGPAATGTLVACQCGAATERFVGEYRSATGSAPTAYAAETYDLTAIVLRGIVSGHAGRTELRAYLHVYNGDGIAHSYGWGATGELADPRIWLYRIS